MSMVWDPLRIAAAGVITGNYIAVGTPLQHPARIIDITNLCNETLYMSTDGIEDMIVVPADAGKVKDICAARSGGDLGGAYVAVNTTFYVRSPSGAATGDSVFIEIQYIFGD